MIKSLEKIAKEEAALEITSKVLSDVKGNIDLKAFAPPTPLLKLKIRNTTEYLMWRIAVLKRDDFTCKICHASVKENKSLRLEVHAWKKRLWESISKNKLISVKK